MHSTTDSPTGPEYWMARVAQECDRAQHDFAPEIVHDLRVALRRCLSIADVFMVLDPHPAWRQMKGEAKRLFEQLGALRDAQVMMEWANELAQAEIPVPTCLIDHLSDRETQFKEAAADALRGFSQKKWAQWTRRLAKRAHRVPIDGMAFQHLALERWMDAHRMHRQARRNRSHAAYHRLRIGLKKFRYVVENFLPSRHEIWGGDMRMLQDLLGEMHDLHVFRQTALAIRAFGADEMRAWWMQRISGEIGRRLERYRQMMVGKESLWQVWRVGLPGTEQLCAAALARLRAWALFRDPDFPHSEQVAKLALQIYDGLDTLDLVPNNRNPHARFMLEAASLVRDAGLAKAQKKHHVATCRMVRKFPSSPGLSAEYLAVIALIARFHRGALPSPDHKSFSRVPVEQRDCVVLLCGILRLATAFGLVPQRIHKLSLRRTSEALYVEAPGYSEQDASAERLAASRHLLETACRMPILIRPLGTHA